MPNKSIPGTEENWESGTLGSDEAFVQIATDISNDGVDDLLGLQMISLRLPKGMVADLKQIAKHNNLRGYQPLIRRVLKRFIDAEMKIIAQQLMEKEEEVYLDEQERLAM